jgi:uncharacterized protein YbaP (TraB family)
MKLRNAGLLVAILAAAVSCDRGSSESKPAVAPVGQGGTGSADPWNKPEPKQERIAKPLFWKLEKAGTTSYLLGTMHLGVDPAALPQIVWDKLDAAKTFAMEIDPTQMSGIDLRRKDGKTLRDELGEAYWKKLEDALGADEAKALLGMKAMIPATVIGMRGLPKTPGMDGVLHGRAVNQKKNLVYLETLALEMEVLEKWMNARTLKDMLDDLPGGDQRAKDMLAAYLAGDEGRIQAIQDSERDSWKKKGRPEKEYDEQMEDLLFKRNASWIPPIEKLHAEGGGFVAIGAAHAIGPRSVLEMLEAKGFQITRIAP